MKSNISNNNEQKSTFAYHTRINGTDYFVRVLSAKKATKSYEDLIKKRLFHTTETKIIHEKRDDESVDM